MFKLLGLSLAAMSFCILPLSANIIGSYSETTLQTNLTDPNLVNPWGVSFSSSSPFWVSDNGTGKATLYNSAGVAQSLIVSMPAGAQPVTGQVSNSTANFNTDAFLFATENGKINGWRPALGTSAETLFTENNASYKGLAIDNTQDTLYAANFGSGSVDVFNSSGLTGSFSDPTIPAGFAPFNVQNIGGVIFVTFAKVGPGGDDAPGAGNGFVATFNPTTHTFTPLIAQGALNSPWGVAIAPASFGAAAGDLLVGNFGDGSINAFNPVTGAFIGTLGNVSSSALSNDGLWALTFGNGSNGGSPNSLYITAGPDDEMGGLFARIDPTPEPSAFVMGAIGLVFLAFASRRPTRFKR